MVETIDEKAKKSPAVLTLKTSLRWGKFLFTSAILMLIFCWALLEFVIEPVFQNQEILMTSLGPVYEMELLEIHFEEKPHKVANIGLTLSLSDKKTKREIELKKPKLIEIIYDTVSQESPESLFSAHSRRRLKRNLVNNLNSELSSGKIIQVYITKFVVTPYGQLELNKNRKILPSRHYDLEF